MLLSRRELIRKVAKLSRLSQPTVKKVLDALDDEIFEESNKATFEEDVYIKLSSGVHYRCKRVKDYVVRDPSSGTYTNKGEELVPSIKFLPAFRGVLNKRRDKADYSRLGKTYKEFMERFKKGGAFEALKKEK